MAVMTGKEPGRRQQPHHASLLVSWLITQCLTLGNSVWVKDLGLYWPCLHHISISKGLEHLNVFILQASLKLFFFLRQKVFLLVCVQGLSAMAAWQSPGFEPAWLHSAFGKFPTSRYCESTLSTGSSCELLRGRVVITSASQPQQSQNSLWNVKWCCVLPAKP